MASNRMAPLLDPSMPFKRRSTPLREDALPFWDVPGPRLVERLGSSESGLASSEAYRRLEQFGSNTVAEGDRRSTGRMLLAQLQNPLAWLLLFAATVSSLAGEWTDAGVIAAILLLSAVLGFAQEHRAASAIAALKARLALRSDVLRDGQPQSVATSTIVPGDVVMLAAGSLVPADGVVLEARDFFVSEAVLTGESYPVEKSVGVVFATATLRDRTNCVFCGSSVRSGTARVLIARTGHATEYGQVAARLALRPAETDFDRGLRQFGHLLTRTMFVLVAFTTAANILAAKPPVDSLLFAIALAVGLAPEMLPAVVAINLARGARDMARRGVIVRKLSAIENFGAMDVLCTDKTGTLTEGRVVLERATDAWGRPSHRVFDFAAVNATMQTGLVNPLDEAIVERVRADRVTIDAQKIDEIPYDFSRKRLTVIARENGLGTIRLISKGAVASILRCCDRVREDEQTIRVLDEVAHAEILAHVDRLGDEGNRALAVASKEVSAKARYSKDDESGLVFEGFIELRDRPKPGVDKAIRDLRALGVDLKVVSGDSRAVAVHVAKEVGIVGDDGGAVLTGAEVADLRDEALWHIAERTSVFAEVDPHQKERILLALRRTGHVVGFMGDGINDAPALHSADVGISVEGATDVAREAAEFILLERDLRVLHEGIVEGRVTFANTLKYLFTTESANFGNMVSMALAAAFLPFLPLLASQVLLNNFLSDIPAMALASDAVDPEQLERPLRWDIGFMKKFMVLFGLVSSVFDLVTFGVLFWFMHATPPLFRTAWFTESLLTELAVALVVRTRRPFYRSRPSRWLLILSGAVGAIALLLPGTPVGAWIDLVPLPPSVLLALLAITAVYVVSVEATKRLFFRSAATPASQRKSCRPRHGGRAVHSHLAALE